MKEGYNQNLYNNNYLKSNSVSISNMKRHFKNIDNNLNDSDSDEEHKERTQKVINDKLKSNNSNSVFDNIPKNRIEKYNVNGSNREKNNMKRKMDNPNTNNNINFNRGYILLKLMITFIIQIIILMLNVHLVEKKIISQ